jgi:DnaJ family protein C protein 7
LIVAILKHPILNYALFNVHNTRGIKPADTAADIKKAYHKAALRHHPDKV